MLCDCVMAQKVGGQQPRTISLQMPDIDDADPGTSATAHCRFPDIPWGTLPFFETTRENVTPWPSLKAKLESQAWGTC